MEEVRFVQLYLGMNVDELCNRRVAKFRPRSQRTERDELCRVRNSRLHQLIEEGFDGRVLVVEDAVHGPAPCARDVTLEGGEEGHQHVHTVRLAVSETMEICRTEYYIQSLLKGVKNIKRLKMVIIFSGSIKWKIGSPAKVQNSCMNSS